MTTKRKSNFRGTVSADAKKQKSNDKGKSYLVLPNGIEMYNIEKNMKEVSLDIIPYTVTDKKHPSRDASIGIALEGSLWYRRPILIHRNIGIDNEVIICPKSVGKPCPICDHQKKLFDEEQKEAAIELYPKPRSLYVVIPRGEKDFEEVPHIWDMSDRLFQEILNDDLEIHDEYETFPDLEEGFTLDLTLKWKTLGKSRFPETRSIDFIERKPIDEKILKDVPDVDNMLIILSYEEIESKFFEMDDEDDAGKLKETEDTPSTERKRKTIAPEKEESNDEFTPPSWDELNEMSRRRIERFCDKNNISVDPGDYEDTDEDNIEFKKAIAKELDIELPAEKKSSRAPKKEKEIETTDDDCPNGYEYGVDWDSKPKCGECEVWNTCGDANEKLKK